MSCSIRDAKKSNVKVVDVVILVLKKQLLAINGGDEILSSLPLSEWEVINEMNHKDMVNTIMTF